MSRRRVVLALLVLVVVGASAQAVAGGTAADFTATSANAGNTIATAADWRPPAVSAQAVARVGATRGGYVRPGGTYQVHAQVADTSGNPPSGVSSVAADVSALTAGQISVALATGSFSLGPLTFNRRSLVLTAGTGLADGSYTYSVTATDSAGNASSPSPGTVVVDGTAPRAADVQATNGTGTAGRPDAGDRLVLTFTEAGGLDPASVASGWDGTSRNVVVRLAENGGNDALTVYDSANTTPLNLGVVQTQANLANQARTFGATGTPSTIVLTGGNVVTVTLGTPSGATRADAAATMNWTPNATAVDLAGNAAAGTPAFESGSPADVDF